MHVVLFTPFLENAKTAFRNRKFTTLRVGELGVSVGRELDKVQTFISGLHSLSEITYPKKIH